MGLQARSRGESKNRPNLTQGHLLSSPPGLRQEAQAATSGQAGSASLVEEQGRCSNQGPRPPSVSPAQKALGSSCKQRPETPESQGRRGNQTPVWFCFNFNQRL